MHIMPLESIQQTPTVFLILTAPVTQLPCL